MTSRDLSKQTVGWVAFPNPADLFEWRLMVRNRRCAATVWKNGVWHTWDHNGNGGENSSEKTVERAKIEAAASAIAQGFI